MGALASLAVLATATLSAVVPATSAAATADRNALVIDMLGSGSAVNTTYDSAGSSVPVAGPSSSVVGGVRITHPTSVQSGPGLEVLPADGTPLAVGRYTDISGQWSSAARPLPVVRLLGAGSGCTQFAVPGNVPVGWLDVKEISYASDGVVTGLAADYELRCTTSGFSATGSVRFQSDVPFTSAPSRVSGLGRVVAGSTTPVTVSITNRGTDPLTLSAPTVLDAAGAAATLVLAPDGETCSQAPIDPGASCTVSFSYTADGPAGGTLLREARLAAPSLLRQYVSIQISAAGTIVPPQAPLSVVGDQAYDGVRVRWVSNNSVPDGWKVYRVDGASPTLVATVPMSTNEWTDTALTKGENATYEVRAYNAAGETAAPAITLTRPDLPDPPLPVDRHVLVVEDSTGSVQSATATVASSAYPTLFTVVGGGVSLLLPRIPLTPGSYPIGIGAGQLRVGVASPGYSCITYGGSVDGTVDVRQSWIGAALGVRSLDADFHLVCAGSLHIEVQVRLGVDTPVTSLTSTGSLQSFSSTVGQAPDVKPLTLSNDGSTDVAIAASTTSGADPAAYSVSSGDCPDVLAPGGTCSLQIAFAPSQAGHRVAKLAVNLGTVLGSRTFDLAGDALGPPAVQVPMAQPVLGRVLLSWYSSFDGGSPITGLHVLRATGDGPLQTVMDLPPSTYSWVDSAVTPGTTYRYQLVTDNQYGAVAPTAEQSVTVTVPHEELIASVAAGAPAADLSALTVGTESRPVPLGTTQDTDEPALSPDGRSLVYVVYDATGNAGIWLRSLEGPAAARQLVDDPAADELDPAWSPDGKTVAYTRTTGGFASAVWTIATTTGATATPLAGGAAAANPSYLPDGSAVVVSDLSSSALGLARVTLAGARTSLSGTTGGRSPAVSPRGDRIAYVSTDSQGLDRLWLTSANGGTPQSLASDYASSYDRPAWSPDGAGLVVNKYGPYGSAMVTMWRDAIGTQPAVTEDVRAAVGYDVYGLTWRREDLTAPVVTFPGAPKVTSGSARVPVSVVDDTSPVGGLSVACQVDGKAVARCAAGFAGTLPTGTHTLAVTAGDAHGHSSTGSYTWTVDATPPAVLTHGLPLVSVTSPVPFGYGAKDTSGVVSYDVRYRRAPWSGTTFSGFSTPTGWAATTATSRSISLASGYEYCFSVRARDRLGNLSAYSAEGCTSAPLDDRSLVRAGFTQITGSGYYAGTAARATARGASLTRTGVAAARQLLVVATSCPTCGTLDVYIGSSRIGAVNLASATTVNKRVFTLPAFATRSGTVVLKVTSSGKPVVVDALGVRK